MAKIVVVGGGIVGLSSAVCVQTLLPDAQVTILSELWYRETTSNGAAGLFRPDHVVVANSDAIIKTSFDYYWFLHASKQARHAGIFALGGYIVSNDDPELPQANQYRHVVPNYRRLDGKELDCFGGPWRYGCYHSSLVIEPAIYMRYLGQRFENSHGETVQRRLTSLRELFGEFDVVVNCCGLGARELVGDESVLPVRGQLVRVHAPWMKEFIMAENTTYVYPNSESVVLGGTRQLNDWSTSVRDEESQQILGRCADVIPALEEALVINEWAGLRPWRPSVRLEKEMMPLSSDKFLPVVHNYGHGGNGITLSWGCGIRAANLVKELLDDCWPATKLI